MKYIVFGGGLGVYPLTCVAIKQIQPVFEKPMDITRTANI